MQVKIKHFLGAKGECVLCSIVVSFGHFNQSIENLRFLAQAATAARGRMGTPKHCL